MICAENKGIFENVSEKCSYLMLGAWDFVKIFILGFFFGLCGKT